MTDVWDKLDQLIDERWQHGEEVAVKLDVVSESMWSGEIRWTPRPNSFGPDRSVVFFAAGGAKPADVAAELVGALRTEVNMAGCESGPERSSTREGGPDG